MEGKRDCEVQTDLQCYPHFLNHDELAQVVREGECQTYVSANPSALEDELTPNLKYVDEQNLRTASDISLDIPKKSNRLQWKEPEVEPSLMDSQRSDSLSKPMRSALKKPGSCHGIEEECQTDLMVYPHLLEENQQATITNNFEMQTSLTFLPNTSTSDVIPMLKTPQVHAEHMQVPVRPPTRRVSDSTDGLTLPDSTTTMEADNDAERSLAEDILSALPESDAEFSESEDEAQEEPEAPEETKTSPQVSDVCPSGDLLATISDLLPQQSSEFEMLENDEDSNPHAISDILEIIPEDRSSLNFEDLGLSNASVNLNRVQSSEERLHILSEILNRMESNKALSSNERLHILSEILNQITRSKSTVLSDVSSKGTTSELHVLSEIIRNIAPSGSTLSGDWSKVEVAGRGLFDDMDDVDVDIEDQPKSKISSFVSAEKEEKGEEVEEIQPEAKKETGQKQARKEEEDKIVRDITAFFQKALDDVQVSNQPGEVKKMAATLLHGIIEALHVPQSRSSVCSDSAVRQMRRYTELSAEVKRIGSFASLVADKSGPAGTDEVTQFIVLLLRNALDLLMTQRNDDVKQNVEKLSCEAGSDVARMLAQEVQVFPSESMLAERLAIVVRQEITNWAPTEFWDTNFTNVVLMGMLEAVVEGTDLAEERVRSEVTAARLLAHTLRVLDEGTVANGPSFDSAAFGEPLLRRVVRDVLSPMANESTAGPTASTAEDYQPASGDAMPEGQVMFAIRRGAYEMRVTFEETEGMADDGTPLKCHKLTCDFYTVDPVSPSAECGRYDIMVNEDKGTAQMTPVPANETCQSRDVHVDLSPLIAQAGSEGGVITIPLRLVVSVGPAQMRLPAIQDAEVTDISVPLNATQKSWVTAIEDYKEPYMCEISDVETEANEPKFQELPTYESPPKDPRMELLFESKTDEAEDSAMDPDNQKWQCEEVQTDLTLGDKLHSDSLNSLETDEDDNYETSSEGPISARKSARTPRCRCNDTPALPWGDLSLPSPGKLTISRVNQEPLKIPPDLFSSPEVRALAEDGKKKKGGCCGGKKGEEQPYKPLPTIAPLPRKISLLFRHNARPTNEDYAAPLARLYRGPELSMSLPPSPSGTQMPWDCFVLPTDVRIRRVRRVEVINTCCDSSCPYGPCSNDQDKPSGPLGQPAASSTPAARGYPSYGLPVAASTPISRGFYEQQTPTSMPALLGPGSPKVVSIMSPRQEPSCQTSCSVCRLKSSNSEPAFRSNASSAPASVKQSKAKLPCGGRVCQPCQSEVAEPPAEKVVDRALDPVVQAFMACEAELRPIRDGLNLVQQKLRNMNLPELEVMLGRDKKPEKDPVATRRMVEQTRPLKYRSTAAFKLTAENRKVRTTVKFKGIGCSGSLVPASPREIKQTRVGRSSKGHVIDVIKYPLHALVPSEENKGACRSPRVTFDDQQDTLMLRKQRCEDKYRPTSPTNDDMSCMAYCRHCCSKASSTATEDFEDAQSSRPDSAASSVPQNGPPQCPFLRAMGSMMGNEGGNQRAFLCDTNLFGGDKKLKINMNLKKRK